MNISEHVDTFKQEMKRRNYAQNTKKTFFLLCLQKFIASFMADCCGRNKYK